MNMVIMVSVVSIVGVVLLAAGVYLVDKNADRRDDGQDN
jgi:hypothetical protein